VIGHMRLHFFGHELKLCVYSELHADIFFFFKNPPLQIFLIHSKFTNIYNNINNNY